MSNFSEVLCFSTLEAKKYHYTPYVITVLQYSGGGAVALHSSRGTVNVLKYSGGGAVIMHCIPLEVLEMCYNTLEVGL